MQDHDDGRSIIFYRFPITVNYTQVLAFLRHLDRPGLLWSDEHVAQGFAWSPGIVSFGVPDHDGECLIEVNTQGSLSDLSTEMSLWSIEVPFDADETEVAVGTILDDKTCVIEIGKYRLVFEAHSGRLDANIDYSYHLRFLFMRSERQVFEILKQGSLATSKVLTTTAEKA